MSIVQRLGLAPFILFTILLAGLPASGQQDQAASQTPALTASLPDLTPDANGNLSQEQMRQLIKVVTENYRANYKNERDYTYIDREVENKLDGSGAIKGAESKTYEIMELYGEQVQRLIAKDDKPLSGKDAAKEQERIEKLTSKRKNGRRKKRNNKKRIASSCAKWRMHTSATSREAKSWTDATTG